MKKIKKETESWMKYQQKTNVNINKKRVKK